MSIFQEQKMKLLDSAPLYEGSMIAGGAVNSVFTGRAIADFDVYFKSEEAFVKAVYAAYEDGLWCCHASHRSITFDGRSGQTQFMHFDYFEDASKVFDAFDFTVCMGAYDIDSRQFVLHDNFLTDCSARRLRFHAGTRFPLISALRVLKYQDRGYKIEREDMLNLALACAGLDLKSWDDLEHQIGGIYGDRTAFAKDGEFSVAKAIEAISRPVVPNTNQSPVEQDHNDHLGSPERLLAHLGKLAPLPMAAE